MRRTAFTEQCLSQSFRFTSWTAYKTWLAFVFLISSTLWTVFKEHNGKIKCTRGSMFAIHILFSVLQAVYGGDYRINMFMRFSSWGRSWSCILFHLKTLCICGTGWQCYDILVLRCMRQLLCFFQGHVLTLWLCGRMQCTSIMFPMQRSTVRQINCNTKVLVRNLF